MKIRVISFMFALVLATINILLSTEAEDKLPNVFAIMKRDFRDNLFIYFKNTTKEPIMIKKIYIQDKDVTLLARKGQKTRWNEERAGIVRWYDVVPLQIGPGYYGVVRIRFGKRGELGRTVKVRLVSEKGVRVVDRELVVMKNPDVSFSYYSFDIRLKELYLYVDASRDVRIGKLYIDGKNIPYTSKEVWSNSGRKIILKVSLPLGAQEGEYKIVNLLTNKGISACVIKVIRPFFSIGMFHVQRSEVGNRLGIPPPEEWIRDCKEHYINTLAYGYYRSNVRTWCEKYGLKMSFPPTFEGIGGWAKKFSLHPINWGWTICDEPEGWDCPPMRLVKVMNLLRKNGPTEFGSIVHCSRLAHFEYNFDDFPFFDYYPVPSAPLIGAGRMTAILKFAAQPKPVGFIPQAFRGGVSKKTGGSNLWRWGRFPTPEEERLMVYDAVANGAKAIHYFAYCVEPVEPIYGTGETKEKAARILWDEIGRTNAELEMLSPWLWKSDVVSIANTTESNIEVKSLIATDEAIIVILLNRDYSYKKSGFSYKPKRNIEVRVRIPEWFTPYGVYMTRWNVFRKLNYKRRAPFIHIKVPKVRICETLVIPANESVFLDILERRFDTLIAVRRLEKTPTIDGDLSDWKGIEPLVLDPNFAHPKFYYSSQFKESSDLSVRVYLGWNKRNFYIGAKVKDDVHKQSQTGMSIWKEDLLQIAFDPQNNSYNELGFKEDDLEYGFALTPKGVQAYCWHNPRKDKRGLRKDLAVAVKREGNYTIYEVAIPLRELNLSPERIFGFNFVVVDADGGAYWDISNFLQFTPGIVGGKIPSAFRKFILLKGG